MANGNKTYCVHSSKSVVSIHYLISSITSLVLLMDRPGWMQSSSTASPSGWATFSGNSQY